MHVGRRHIRRYMKFLSEHNRKRLLPIGAVVLLLAALVLGVMTGAAELSFSEMLGALLDAERTSAAAKILWYVRIPRVCAAAVCGAALAVAGAVIQGVLANHLASPGMIGVNAGAGVAVTICAACGILGGWTLSLFAFLGAFLTMLAVSLSAKRWGATDGVVILIGAALNSLLGAVSDAIVTVKPDISVMNHDFRMGDFSAVTAAKLLPAAVIILGAITALLFLTSELDILTLGEDHARGLGMRTGRMRLLFLLLAALLSGAAVCLAGLMSFVGLLVPHAVRRIVGTSAARVLPFCALLGGAFTVLCDTAARVLFAPYELPVGIFLAFLGAPFFLYLLLRGRRGGSHD